MVAANSVTKFDLSELFWILAKDYFLKFPIALTHHEKLNSRL